MRNEQAIRKLKAHLHMIYGLADDLSGSYGSVGTLMKLYGEAFNHITTELLPQMGMSEDEVRDLLTSIEPELEVA